MENITALYEQIDARIVAIADECEAKFEALLTTPEADYRAIESEIAALANEHEELIPKWKALRYLMQQTSNGDTLRDVTAVAEGRAV